MNRSKISRSIVVVIFIALILFLGYFDIKCISNSKAQSLDNKLYKIGYVCVLISLVIAFMWIKEKLYKKKFKRKNSLIIRYIYLIIAIVLTSLFFLKQKTNCFSTYFLVICLFAILANSFLVKKIIFNISKSDMLSVIGLFSYSMLPTIFENESSYIISLFLTLFTFCAILNMQVLIDELKQRGIKNKKYLILTFSLGVFIGLSWVFGINYFVWCIMALVLLVITINLDNTHLSFPKKVMNSVTQEKREKLYSIERINISKLLICIIITLVVMFVVYILSNIAINKLVNVSNNEIVQAISQNINNNISNIKNTNNDESLFNKIAVFSALFVSKSKGYYLVIFVYIILIELLNIVLKRKYDTKSTVIKSLFFIIYIFVAISNMDIYIFQPLFSILLVIIVIVNTSNIYLNREERVKMLVA